LLSHAISRKLATVQRFAISAYACPLQVEGIKMKRLVRLVLFSMSFCFAASALAADDPYELFDARAAQLRDAVAHGTYTELQASKEMSEYTDQILPNDYKLRAVMAYRVLLASRLERGDIKRDEFDYLWKERKLQFMEQRTAEMNRDAAAQQTPVQASNQTNPVATAFLLQSIGNAFRSAAPRSPVNCTSVPVGTAMSTTCN
jgi:hypothetical protein